MLVKNTIRIAFTVLFITAFVTVFSYAQETPLLRDYAVVGTIPSGHWEFSLDYMRMNDTIDLFDFGEQELSSSSRKYQKTLGDFMGGRIIVNGGASTNTNIHFGYSRLNLETGPVDLDVDGLEFSLHHQLSSETALSYAVDFGGRLNRAGDKTLHRVDHINEYIKRINPKYSVDETATHYIFRDNSFDVFASKAGRPPLEFSLEDMLDKGLFLRFIAGSDFGKIRPNIFFEVGVTDIDSEISSNLQDFFPGSFNNVIEDFPIDLNRTERYWRIGFDLLLFGPYDLLANLKYEYVSMDRDRGLDYVEYNHIVRADITYPINQTFGLNIGGTYFRRQFNGDKPFMYNRFTQTTFDHDYGYLHAGLVVRF